MKILYVTNQFYLHGGIEKILAQKINYWITNYNYEIILCTSEHGSNKFVYNLDNRVKHIDLAINYHKKISYFHPKNIFKSIYHFFKLKKLIEIEQPQVVISVNYTPEQYFLPFIARHIPKIKEFHSSGATIIKPKNFFEKLKHKLFLVFKKYHKIVVLNSDEKSYYDFLNITVIPNFIEQVPKPNTNTREKTIIAAGRIAEVKQFNHLIRAWSLIENEFPDWNVIIFGEGDQHLIDKLNELIATLQLSNIQLMGVTSQIENEMQRASIYAMTSATECFPMVLLESLANGLPIISYDCPNGPRNIISKGEDGVLVAHNNIEDFSKKLGELIKDTQLRKNMEMNAVKNVNRFNEKFIMEQWLSLFKTI
jgi:glycosyltransferase involved in cell wall biosynthesis